jgi:hypothetical protein
MIEEQQVPGLSERVRTGFRDGLQTTLKMVRFVLPLYIAVDLLKGTVLLDTLGSWCQPVMALFGLPGEAAFAFVAAWLINLYAAIAVMAPLDLSPWQVTQCGLMMGIAHNLLVEGGVLASTGARGGLLTLCRILLAAVAGWVLLAMHALGGA